MEKENGNSKPTNVSQNPPATDKPNVPTPAGPIGSLPPNYTTHGLDPKGSVRMTEDLDNGSDTKEK